MTNGLMTVMIANAIIHAHFFLSINCKTVLYNEFTKTTLSDHSTPLSEFCQLIIHKINKLLDIGLNQANL